MQLIARHPGAPRPVRGVTLIELIFTLVLFGILFSLAIPSFTTWIRNNQIRGVADGLQNGIRVAQLEAVRRNRTVVFYLTNAQPSAAATAIAGGRNWAVRYVPTAIDTPVAPEPYVQGGALSEVSSTVQVAAVGAYTGVCFNPTGRLIAGDAASTGVSGVQCVAGPARFNVRQPASSDAAEMRPLRVDVEIGGRVRMCDPNRPSTAPDTCLP